IAVFDELKQSVREIEFLADPTTGELKIACPLAISFTVIPHVIERFAEKYPRVTLHFDEVASASGARNFPELRDRKYDLVLARGSSLHEDHQADDLNIAFLFDDQLVITAGAQSKWARRRRIDLAELVDEPWIMQAPQTWNHQRLAEAFHARGLDMPKASLLTLSMPIITHFLAKGRSIAAIPRSVARFNSLNVLPRRFADPAVTRRHRDAKKSNIKPGRRALHRLRARGSEIAYGKAANTQVVKGNVGKLQRCAPSRCRLWVSLGPQPMFAARLLHPPAADMTGPPCDVAE